MLFTGSLSGTEHPLLRRLQIDFDVDSRTLERGGRSRHLAPREAALLAALLQSKPGEVVSRSALLDAIWGDGEVCEDALTVLVSRLRRHFDRLGVEECVIKTVPRRGYWLSDDHGELGGLREARRGSRVGIVLGLAAVGLSACSLAVSLVALVMAWI